MTPNEKREKRHACVSAILEIAPLLRLLEVGKLADLMMEMWQSGEIKRNLDRRKR